MRSDTTFAHPKYPLSMRLLHWTRAVLILGLILSGWYMTGLPEESTPMKTFDFFYSNHKQFGVLVWLLAIVHLAIRWQNRCILPHTPETLTRWETLLSHAVHRLIILLTIVTPILGYSMSSTFTESDGVPFFFFGHLPEIFPKNDDVSHLLGTLHAYSAYVLLALIVLHVIGAFKHRLQDKNGQTDVLPRML